MGNCYCSFATKRWLVALAFSPSARNHAYTWQIEWIVWETASPLSCLLTDKQCWCSPTSYQEKLHRRVYGDTILILEAIGDKIYIRSVLPRYQTASSRRGWSLITPATAMISSNNPMPCGGRKARHIFRPMKWPNSISSQKMDIYSTVNKRLPAYTYLIGE